MKVTIELTEEQYKKYLFEKKRKEDNERYDKFYQPIIEDLAKLGWLPQERKTNNHCYLDFVKGNVWLNTDCELLNNKKCWYVQPYNCEFAIDNVSDIFFSNILCLIDELKESYEDMVKAREEVKPIMEKYGFKDYDEGKEND